MEKEVTGLIISGENTLFQLGALYGLSLRTDFVIGVNGGELVAAMYATGNHMILSEKQHGPAMFNPNDLKKPLIMVGTVGGRVDRLNLRPGSYTDDQVEFARQFLWASHSPVPRPIDYSLMDLIFKGEYTNMIRANKHHTWDLLPDGMLKDWGATRIVHVGQVVSDYVVEGDMIIVPSPEIVLGQDKQNMIEFYSGHMKALTACL